MNILKARIIDETHLELNQSIISVRKGDYIHILIIEDGTDNIIWNEISKKYFLESYDDGDSIYDNI